MNWTSVKRTVDGFIRRHRAELASIDVVVGVSRGGLIPAALIATAIDRPMVAAYIDRQDRVYLDRGAWLESRRVLLVDDIVRTGKTFRKMIALLGRKRPATLLSFTLLCLTDATVTPTWTRLTRKDARMPWDAL